MHIEALANGLGGQSAYLFYLACIREIPATVSITADTGWENDCLWSDGRVTTARQYFEEVILPMSEEFGIPAYMVRAVDRFKNPLPSLRDATIKHIEFLNRTGNNCIKIPFYGSRNGQLRQSCTQRWKITAIHQQLRRLGAKTAKIAQGIHYDEFMRRAKGEPLGRDENGFMMYQTGKHDNLTRYREVEKDGFIVMEKYTERVWTPFKWLKHYYPLVGMRMGRDAVRKELESLDIPYLLSTECDGCPHKDAPRWNRTSPHVIQDLAMIEEKAEGSFFFTNKRIPLLQSLEQMGIGGDEIDFGCDNDICGI
jgi:hypothetical protein